MGVITLEDLTQSVAYKEIFGQGRQAGRLEAGRKGRVEGRHEGELDLTPAPTPPPLRRLET
jgi:hypothetical protein